MQLKPGKQLMRRALLPLTLAVALAALTLAGCAAAAPTSGVSGRATLGPVCPVERMPPDPACAPRPLAQVTLIVKRHGGAATVAKAKTDKAGRFRVPLRPGLYDLYADAGIRRLAAPVMSFRVRTGRYTQLVVRVDSGIR